MSKIGLFWTALARSNRKVEASVEAGKRTLDQVYPVSDTGAARLERLAAQTPWFILAYVAVNFAVRLLISPNLEFDEAEFVGRTGFAFGYPNSHPPLFNWIVGIFYALTGNWVAALAIPKHILLAGTYLLVFDLVCRLTGRTLPGAVAVAAFMLVPELVYYSEYTRTHSVLALSAAVACFHAIVLIVERPSALRFVWLGLALGAGLLAKYNFVLFVAALAAAIWLTPLIRKAVLVPKAFLTAGIVTAMVAPHIVWAFGNMDLVTERLRKLDRTERELVWFDMPGLGLDGFANLVLVLLGWCALLTVFWRLARLVAARHGVSATASRESDAAFARLFGLTVAVGIAIFALLVLLGDIHDVRARYITPVLMAFPLWLVLRWPIDSDRVAAGRFLASGAGAAVIFTVVWPIVAMTLPTPFNFPFADMADAIDETTKPPFAVLAADREIRANLAIRLEGATVWDEDKPAERVLFAWYGEGQRRAPQELAPLYRPLGDIGSATFPLRGPRPEVRTLSWQLYELADGSSGAVGTIDEAQ